MTKVLVKILPAMIVFLVWQFLIYVRPHLEFFIGSPLGVLNELGRSVRDGQLPEAILVTGFEALIGFLAGSIIGTLAGLLFWHFKWLNDIFRTYLSVLGAVPIFALGPVLVFWFGTGLWSKIVLGFLSTLILAVSQAFNGASEVDPNLQKLMRVFGATPWQIFSKLVLPSSLIWLLAGIRINIGLALLGAFIGEFIASKRGLGYMIIVAQGLYNVNQIWVAIGGIMFIALLFYILTGPIERRARRWQESYDSAI